MTNEALTLPEIFKIDAVTSVHEQLDALLSNESPLEVSGESVTSVDFCALQLLAATQATLVQQGTSIVWQDISEALRDAIELASMTDLLGVSK